MTESRKGRFAAATLLNQMKGKRNGHNMVKQEPAPCRKNYENNEDDKKIIRTRFRAILDIFITYNVHDCGRVDYW